MSGSRNANTTSVVDLVAALRADRCAFLNELAREAIASDSLYARIQADSSLHQLYVVKIVESLPRVGKVQARRALESLGIGELSPAVNVDQAAWGVLLAGAEG